MALQRRHNDGKKGFVFHVDDKGMWIMPVSGFRGDQYTRAICVVLTNVGENDGLSAIMIGASSRFCLSERIDITNRNRGLRRWS
jgi:hypothetical protein